MIGSLIEASARHRGPVFFAAALIALGGLWCLQHVSLDALPDLSDRQVIILSEWEGRSPELVEAQVTYPIVSKLLGAPKVKVVRGQSFFGISFVYVIFEEGTELYWARSRTLEYLNRLQGNLPAGVTPVLGPDASGVGWVYQYALVDESGAHDLQDLRSLQDWHLKVVLESVPGVAEVASIGGFVKQYQVELDPAKLLAHRVTVEEILHAVRSNNHDSGGRVIELGSTEYMLRGRGALRSLDDLRNVVLRTGANGAPILLGEVAEVTIGAEPRRGLAELDGKGETVGGIVIARDGQNALEVIEDVKTRIAELALPAGVKLVSVYDRSELILRAIDALGRALIEQLIVVAIFIVIFLFHVRSALVPIISLPLAVLASFIPIYVFGISVNIMSLGGIIIAVGAMVDASVILVENAHKRLEEKGLEENSHGDRNEVLIAAFKEVGPSVFASLLVLAISFLPVFALEDQEGRLFKPLAFGKTFAMIFAALFAVTLVPALGRTLIRGRIIEERVHPISRALHKIYEPVLRFSIRRRTWVISAAILIVASTIPIYQRLGSELMPPLNEGSILYMPSTLPGLSISEAARILQTQDQILRSFPEVASVFGKIGRADTATDPAPLSMAETTILLHPQDQWRSGKTWDELIAEMNAKLQIPGMPPSWWMPVQARTEMLNTGVRSRLALKIFGADLKEIEKIAIELELALKNIPGTRNVFAERLTGGSYLDYELDRRQLARYGLSVENVETALAGATAGEIIEGRERYGIAVQYQRAFRDDPERILVPLPYKQPPPSMNMGGDPLPTELRPHIPLSMLATIRFNTGPHMIQNEDGYPYGVVFVDIEDRDYRGYVERAKTAAAAISMKLPTGYRIEWSGQYQAIQRVHARLGLIIPLTLLLAFGILYTAFKSWRHTAIVMLAVPFSLAGAVWMLWLLDFNMSVAVWVGLIALAGIDAETGVVMLLYLDLAHERRKREGRMNTVADLEEAIHEGAVKRLRPKVMTVFTDVVGLMPIMFASSMAAGADVTQRMAAPIIGGLLTSFLLELTIYPAIYAAWKRSHLGRASSPSQR